MDHLEEASVLQTSEERSVEPLIPGLLLDDSEEESADVWAPGRDVSSLVKLKVCTIQISSSKNPTSKKRKERGDLKARITKQFHLYADKCISS